MKTKILASIVVLACLSACNDDYSNQFNVSYPLVDTLNKTIILSPEAYSAIASNDSNKAIATALDPENETFLNALKVVGTNKYFTEEAPAETYIPAYLSAIYPFADPNSKFIVTYNQYQAPSDYMSSLNNITTFTLTQSNYESVWGSDIDASYLTPSTISKIPTILNNSITDAEDGDIKVVNYAFSSVEPSTSGSGTTTVISNIGDVLASEISSEHTIKGSVIATNSKSMLLRDNTGSILIYLSSMPNYSVGDIVTVKGKTSQFNKLMQISNPTSVEFEGKNSTFAYPTPTNMDANSLLSYILSPSIKYASINGTLSMSNGKYYLTVTNLTQKGNVRYPVGGIINPDLLNKSVKVTGYLIGANDTSFDIMATDVLEQFSTLDYTPIGEISYLPDGGYLVAGTVAATYSKGFLLTDGTGNILVYQGELPTCNVGDIVEVKGSVKTFSGLKQIDKGAEIRDYSTGGTFSYPKPRVLLASDFDDYISNQYSAYVQYEGTLSIANGKYYNVNIDGTTTAFGSISNPISGLVSSDLVGQKVIVTGYLIGISGEKYVNTMATSVVAASKSRNASGSLFINRKSRASLIDTNKSVLYSYNGTSWSLYSLGDDVNLVVAQPELYDQLGISYIINPNFVIPQYLSTQLPYAQDGDKAVIVYNENVNAPVAKEYTYDSGWSETTTSTPVTTTFTVDANREISADLSTYYSNSFLGDTGGFTIQNVNIGSLNFVWSNTETYGWKATAYVNKVVVESESWIVSPAISLKKATTPILTFDEAHRFTNNNPPTDYFSVLVSTNYTGDINTATWTTLTVPNWSDGLSWDFVNIGNIDLSAFNGQVIYVGLKYVSTSLNAPTWEVKNFAVEELVEDDSTE